MRLRLLENADMFRYQVLHEFGHVLGCVHEHSSPKANINWDAEKVYQHFSRWDRSRVDRQVLRRFLAAQVTCSDFDIYSVMIYPIQGYLVEERGFKIDFPRNSELSECDKAFIRLKYPPHTLAETSGRFYSWHYHSWERRDPRNSAQVPFKIKARVKPAIAVGLVEIDLVGKGHLRIEAAAPQSDITTAGFMIQTQTWEGSGLCSAAAMWFRIDDPAASRYQTGTLDTLSQVSDLSPMAEKQDFTVKFARPYTCTGSQPKVILWLRGVHLGGHGGPSSTSSRHLSWSLYLSVHDVTAEGFRLHVDRDADTNLYRAMVTWVAYSETMVGVFSGMVQSQDIATEPTPWTRLNDNRRGFEKLVDISEDKKKQGCAAPNFQVCAGITSFKLRAVDNLRLHADVQQVRDSNSFASSKFWIRIMTWNKSVLTSASVSWLAVLSE